MKTIWKIHDPIENKYIGKADTWESAAKMRETLEARSNRALFIEACPDKHIEIEE